MKKTNLVLIFMLIMLLALSTSLMAQNNALDFDGVNDYVELGTPSQITSLGSGSLTIEAWIKTSDANTRQCIVGNWDYSSHSFVLELYTSGNLRLYVDASGYNSNEEVDDGLWHHVVGIRDITNNKILMYVDGVEIHNQSVSTSSYTITNSTRIGRNYNDSYALHFEGLIEDVRIWNDVRTETEIQNNMYNELTGTEDNLVAYYNFNEGAGSTAGDSAGNNDGTLINGPTWILSDSPLPVNLSSFYATYIGGTPTLYWTTQSEEENAYWNVYRGNNNNFTEATHLNANNPVQGNGTTNNASDYIYVDTVPVVQNTTYWYWIEDVSTDGETEVHEPITLTVPLEDTPEIPLETGLHQNYPNPFNPSTTISFTLTTESTEKVEIEIFNVKGQNIRTYPVILSGVEGSASYHSIIWDGKDKNGKAVSSGVYYYKLITDTEEYQRKMLLVK